MIRKQISNQRQSEQTSTAPRRRKISGIPAPTLPSDERDLSDDDLAASLRLSYLAEQKRVAEAIRQEIGDDLLSLLRDSLANMSGRGRRRVLALLDRRLRVR